jgi:hypothetical protein
MLNWTEGAWAEASPNDDAKHAMTNIGGKSLIVDIKPEPRELLPNWDPW